MSPVLNTANQVKLGTVQVDRVYCGPVKVWEKPVPPVSFNAGAWGTVRGEYDFGDTARIAHTGGLVTSVTAKSGPAGPITNGGNTARSPVTGTRVGPTGRNVLDFGPMMGQKRLSVGAPSYTPPPTTVVMVAVSDVTASTGPQMFGDDPALYIGANNGPAWTLYATTGGVTNPAVRPDALWHTFVCVFNGANSQLWIDGTLRATVNPGNADTSSLVVGNYGGGGYGFDGAIGHAVWYAGIVADIPGMSASLKALHGTP